MATLDKDAFGLLLHGAARAWRNKLDARLRPLGLSQAKWRTLSHLAHNDGELTQAGLAERIGVEEPTLVGLLHRLEKEGWVKRRSSADDRRCKIVHLQRRSNVVLDEIFNAAHALRHELVSDIAPSELQTCMRVLIRIRAKAEEAASSNRNGRHSAKGKILRK